MELEVGMYIRTKDGEIHKIKSINNEYIEYENGFGVPYELKDYYIIKASHTLLGNDKEPCLIKAGDYVNGAEVILIYEAGDFYNHSNYKLNEKTIEVVNDNYETIPFYALFTNKDIESIVTKEQFESMSYKVVK